jgi:hypothetical protein
MDAADTDAAADAADKSNHYMSPFQGDTKSLKVKKSKDPQ